MSDSLDPLHFDAILRRIRKKLPLQNPLHSFVHNNILQMFEEKEFHVALKEAGHLYGARAYWETDQYRVQFLEKKIIDRDLSDAIENYSVYFDDTELSEKLGMGLADFYQKLMFSDLVFNDDEIWPDITDKNLWEECAHKMKEQVLILNGEKKIYRAKEYWERVYNESSSSTTHPFIIKLISSYLDQGQSFWANPFLDRGFWAFFCEDVEIIRNYGSQWQRILGKKLDSYKNITPEEIITLELDKMGIPRDAWESFLLAILFDLKGWSGMVNKLEVEPWQATIKAPKIKLVDYLASLLLIESSIDTYHAEVHSAELSLIYGRVETKTLKSFQLSVALYQVIKSFQLGSKWVEEKSRDEILDIIRLVDEARREHMVRLWHEAYECHFYSEFLATLTAHTPKVETLKVSAQVLFCIDDREESIRRHVEATNPEIKTFGVVGFFGIDMKFSSLKHKRLIAQCPPVIIPRRIVTEEAKIASQTGSFTRLNAFRGGSDLSLYYISRTLIRGFFSTLVLGMASIVPMILQVFFPQKSRQFREGVYQFISPTPPTEINLEHTDETHGYTKEEMAAIVRTILSMCGLQKEFAPLVIIAGHGSSSNNNPFKQAYGCGACGGNAGIPNSRAFAKMANDPLVRIELNKTGISIPDDTFFVSGFHDTCTDEISYFNLDELPSHLEAEFKKIQLDLEAACKLNAFERCQKFSSFEAKTSPDKALKHVRERAEDLAQPRPEYGHSTNALAVVGPRSMTKGLFLNRRSFLLTYDWEIDPDGAILQQVILGGIPVAVNINMDYYFSSVDNDHFGCGSKLPLNLTSLLGVMTGSGSDLRIGLARQMVEIHEPIRNMTVVYAPLLRVKKIFDGNGRLKNLLYNQWMRLVVFDPEEKSWYLFTKNEFHPLREIG